MYIKCVHLGSHRSHLLVPCDSRHYRHANDLLGIPIHTAQAQPLRQNHSPKIILQAKLCPPQQRLLRSRAYNQCTKGAQLEKTIDFYQVNTTLMYRKKGPSLASICKLPMSNN